MSQNLCTPQNKYGSFDQTLFLGCSVLSFSANAGLNEQSSEVTVELAQDPCLTQKTYIPTNTLSFTPIAQTLADPGFTNPALGSPVYFRVADFEYAGILQSWTKKNSAEGLPIYSVKITDPRTLLDNVQIIVGEYQGKLKGLRSFADYVNGTSVTFPDKILNNIVNVYGFLDSLLATGQGTPGDCPLYHDQDADIKFGAPAGGWGVSSSNDAGIPWNLVRNGLQALLGNNVAANAPDFSAGWIYGPPGGNNGYGEIYTGGAAYTTGALPAKYIIDMSEIPFAPLHYRISGPVITLSELLSQVCRDAGCDYYVELLPTAAALVIKVRVIVRSNQPAMGEISNFVNTANTVIGVSNSTIGKEYRSDPNNAFVIGDNKRSLYRHTGVHTTGSQRSIMPYWGRDLDGKLNPAYENSCEVGWVGPPDWNVGLDINEIDGMLSLSFADAAMTKLKLADSSRVWVWEGEMRASLGTFQDWLTFMMEPNPYCHAINLEPGNAASYNSVTTLRLYLEDLEMEACQNSNVPNGTTLVGNLQALGNVKVGTRKPRNAMDDAMKDAQTIHRWLQNFSQEHYGKTWLVEIPFACWAGDTGNPNLIDWSDSPSTEGAWADPRDFPEILRLDNSVQQGFALDRFKTDDGRVEPILRWTQSFPVGGRNPILTGLKYDHLNSTDYTTDTFNKVAALHGDLYVWQKAEIADSWVTGNPYSGSSTDYGDKNKVWALLTADPVFTGLATNDGKREVGYVQVRSGLRDFTPCTGTGVGGVSLPGCVPPLSLYKSAGGFSDRMLTPNAAAVPVLSNTQTYGPWWKESVSYGTMHAEHDSTLNPWTYGSAAVMDLAGLDKVDKSTTKMNVAERGEVTVAGYPTIGLGAAITSTFVPYATRSLVVGTFYGKPFNFVPLAASVASASVANMNVVVSPQGVTTSYTITTFTPVFGRFSKSNASALAKIGTNRLREQRERRKGLAKGFAKSLGAKGRAFTLLSSLTAGPAYSPNSPGILFVGRQVRRFDPRRKEVIIADKNTLPFYGDYNNTAMMSLDGLIRPVSKSGDGGLPAMKGSGYITGVCPFTGLSQVDPDTTGGYPGLDPEVTDIENRRAPVNPPPPQDKMKGLVISANYLDPLADPKSNSTFTMSVRATGSLGTGIGGAPIFGSGTTASGFDIESVARGDLDGLKELDGVGGIAGESMLIAGDRGRYSGDYRFMALRGPLVLQSWGYDTYGKPIPNSAGWSGDPSYDTGIAPHLQVRDTGNVHQKIQSGLTDRFAPNWLGDSTNWPVAPVDLRFDRARGVWTAPVPFRMMKAEAVQSIAADATGFIELLNAEDMYDENGLSWKHISNITGYDPTGTGTDGTHTGVPLIETGVPPLINLDNWGGSALSVGDKLIVYYDTHSCSYWRMGAGGGGGGEGACGAGYDGIITVVTNFVCIGDMIKACTRGLNFENGCLGSISAESCT